MRVLCNNIMLKRRLILFFIFFIVTTIVYFLHFLFSNDSQIKSYISKNKHFEVVYYENPIISQYVIPIIEDLDNNEQIDGTFDVYLSDLINCKIPQIKNTDNKKIMWLTSICKYYENYLQSLRKVNYVFTPDDNMTTFLRQIGINAYAVPVLYAKTKYKMSPEYYAVIGNLSVVEEELKKRNLKYKKYSNYEEAYEDIPHIKGVFADNGSLYSHDMEYYLTEMLNKISKNILINKDWIGKKYWVRSLVHPFLLDAIYNKIPVVLDIKQDRDALNVFGFNISNTQNKMLKETFNTHNNDLLYNIVKKYYTKEYILNDIKSILLNNKEIVIENFRNYIGIQLVCHDDICGEYWLAQYFSDYIPQKGYVAQIYTGKAHRHYNPAKYVIVNDKVVESSNLGKETYLYWLYAREKNGDDENIPKVSNKYDAIIVASLKIYEQYKNIVPNLYYLPQYTNTKIMYSDYDESKKSEVLFVGNYHFERVAPKVVYQAGIPISVYGNFWNDILPIKGKFIPNDILRKYYSSAKIVLNDTLEGMKAYGFISNRIYDVTACGTLVISDYMPEIAEIYGDSVPMYKNEKELVDLVRYYLDPNNEKERLEKAQRAQRITLKNFTQDNFFTGISEILQLNADENKQ